MSRSRVRSVERRLERLQPPVVPMSLVPARDGSWMLGGRPETYPTHDEAVAAAHRIAAPARPLLMTVVYVDRRADCDDEAQAEAPAPD